jgi:hypothetical protein
MVRLLALAAAAAGVLAGCASPSTPAPPTTLDLAGVDACALLDHAALTSASLARSRNPDEPGNKQRCDYERPNGVDTLIFLRPGMSSADFTDALTGSDRAMQQRDVTIGATAATEVRTSTTRGGHTGCAVVTDFGQRQLTVVIDNDLGGRHESIDSMCAHVTPVAEQVFAALLSSK